MGEIVVRRTRKTAEVRREEIVQAAMRLFARQGYARTTTKEIAAEAGIAEGTIYKYFASKLEILFAFSVPTLVNPIHELLERLGDADDFTIIRALIENRFAIWDQWRDVMRAVLGEALFNDELADAFYQHIASTGLGILETFITRRMAEGRFRSMHPQVVSRSLLGMMLSHFLLWRGTLGGQTVALSRDALIDELARLFLNSLLKHPAEVSA
jgi:AcrR family transcriptional regulator